MAYNKFKIDDLESKLSLKTIQTNWLPKPLPAFNADSLLEQLLINAQTDALYSEKARSEFIIAPTLQALRRKNIGKITLFSGYEFNVEKQLQLHGFCDFIFSLTNNTLKIEAPTILVVEAKRLEPDLVDFGQCGAEMYAAQLFNERAGKKQKAIYGCATSGFSWAFLKLENNILSIDPNYVPLTFDNPYHVLATLQWVLEESWR
ncbi:MAG: hypothetical protein JNM36_19445 [Chitinophagales bacterium]|jgi:hypothetical protein|nr:hypothetical protein [Chitinophagales bacterium]